MYAHKIMSLPFYSHITVNAVAIFNLAMKTVCHDAFNDGLQSDVTFCTVNGTLGYTVDNVPR